MLLNEFLKEHRSRTQDDRRAAAEANWSAHYHRAKSQRASRAKRTCSANSSERGLRLELPGP